MSLSEGTKDDAGKIPMDLLSPWFLLGISEVLQFGAEKYEPYNWAKGIKYSRVYSAMQRHMWAFWRGEDLDDETGMPHLWHAGCCLMFLTHYEQRPHLYKEFDDRPDIYKEDPTPAGSGDQEEALSGTRGFGGKDSGADSTAEPGPSDVRGEDQDWPSSDSITYYGRS